MTLFTADDVISAYSRAQAIEDGMLADVSATAREAGLTFPVALTQAAWMDCVHWTDDLDRRKGTVQDEDGRLWDVLWMLRTAIKRSRANDRSEIRFGLHRVPTEGRGRKARPVMLKALCGPGDNGEPVITIMMLDED